MDLIILSSLSGLHPNAEIGFLTATSEKLFRTVFELQPRESGSGTGPVTTRDEKVKTIIDDVMEKMPEQFNMLEIQAFIISRWNIFFYIIKNIFRPRWKNAHHML